MATCNDAPSLSAPAAQKCEFDVQVQDTKRPLTFAELKMIYEIPGNNVCFECGIGEPDWASVTFGITLCLECAGKHRGYGVHVSFVRSIQLDSWNQDQVRAMLQGGNESFNRLLLQESAASKEASGDVQDLGRFTLYQRLAARSHEDDSLGYVEKPCQSKLPSSAPIWSANSPSCMVCGTAFKPFNISFRRHHCRRCGRCVCHLCAPRNNTRPILEWKIMTPVRHCKECYRSPVANWKNQ